MNFLQLSRQSLTAMGLGGRYCQCTCNDRGEEVHLAVVQLAGLGKLALPANGGVDATQVGQRRRIRQPIQHLHQLTSSDDTLCMLALQGACLHSLPTSQHCATMTYVQIMKGTEQKASYQHGRLSRHNSCRTNPDICRSLNCTSSQTQWDCLSSARDSAKTSLHCLRSSVAVSASLIVAHC